MRKILCALVLFIIGCGDSNLHAPSPPNNHPTEAEAAAKREILKNVPVEVILPARAPIRYEQNVTFYYTDGTSETFKNYKQAFCMKDDWEILTQDNAYIHVSNHYIRKAVKTTDEIRVLPEDEKAK